MKFKKFLILGFLLIALVALPVSFAADVEVTDLNPTNEGGTDLGLEKVNQSISSTSLEEDMVAFDTSNLLNNETIYLNGSYSGSVEKGTLENPYKNINNATKALLNSNKTNLFIANGNYKINNHFDVTDKNINIIGESVTGVKINCNEDYLFAFTNSSSNIYNLIITNGYSNSDYAIIWTKLSNITMCNVVFTNNVANSPGGIILTRSGTFKLINCSIKNNLIDYGDGGISGGIIYGDNNNLIIINSSFVNNTIKSTTYYGGAIYNKGKLEFINSTVSELYVVTDEIIEGAFIYYGQFNNNDYAYIINSSFEKSKFEYVSGLILTDARNCIINNVNISDNYAKYLQGNISVLDLYYTSSIENINIFNNTYDNVSVSLSTVMNFLYRNGYFNISEQLPDKYDLRDYNLTTIAKDQNPLGTCWAFATIAALESYLLKYWNETFDLSENNMKNIMGKNGINGSEWDTNNGGNDVLALAYLLRWSGAVNETDDPYYSDIAKLYDAVAHVQDVIYIPLRLNYTDNDQIKYAIMKYGAVWTEMHATGVIGLNTYSTECVGPDHAVAIVGWDDNYSASNFQITPPGDGAFIVKNSWGSNWGDNGYFYISYYDASFAGFASKAKFSGFVFSNVEKVNNYDSIYYYDPFGNDFVAGGYLSNTAWFANQFVSNDNEILSAFGIYTYGDSNYSVNIYVNDDLVYTQDGVIFNSGYHTIKLTQGIGLNKGDIFKIEVKLTTPNCIYPIALEVPHMGDNPFVNATANPNESFVSVDGVTWDDLTDLIENANVCIKAYTTNYIIEVNATKIDAYVGDIVTLNVSIKGASENISLSEGNISVIFSDFTVINPIIKGNEISFTIPDSNIFGKLIIEFSFSNNHSIFTTLDFTLLKHDSILNVSQNTTIYVLDDGNFVINVSDENNNPICEGVVAIYDNGVNVANLTLTNGTVIWDYNYDSEGVYNISIIYVENNKYYKSIINRAVTVSKVNTNLSLESDVVTTYVFEDVSFVINLTDENDLFHVGNVVVYDNGVNVANLFVNGTIVWNYTFESAGEHNISVVYKGDNRYNLSNVSRTITVNKLGTDLSLKTDIDCIYVFEEGSFVINLTNTKCMAIEGNVVVYDNGVNVANLFVNGTIVWNYTFESAGEHNISVVYDGDNRYNSSNVSRTITVNKLDTNLSLKSFNGDVLSSVTLVTTVESNHSVNGTVSFYVGGNKVATVNVVNGIAKYNYNCKSAGNFKVTAIFNENNVFKSSNNSSNLTVNKIPVSMTIKQNNTYYKSAFITITLNKVIKGQKITLKFSNDKTATVSTNSKGIATYYVPFAVGSYTVTGSASSSYYDIKSVKKSISIKKVTATITAYKLTTTYKSGKYFQVKVTNPKGQIMVGVKLKLKVYTGSKYKTVYITTGTNGIAKYSGSSLSITKHKIIVSNAESTKYMTAKAKTNYLTVKKGTTTITAPVVKNKYKKSQYFKVTIKNKASGKVIGGIYLKIKVYTGKKYKTYTVKTNSKGMAQINTKALSKGSHKVVISTTSKYYTVSKSGYLIKIV